MASELTKETLAELDAAAKRLEHHNVPPKDSQLKLVEKLAEIKHVPLEVDDVKVAERIKQASENSGITFTDLARGCGVTDKVVWQWAATGKISKAKLPTLARLCDVSVTWLLTGEEQESLFAPTEDKFTRTRWNETNTEHEVTTYYPILSVDELLDPEGGVERFYENPSDHSCLAWVGAEDAVGKPKFAFIMNVDWHPPMQIGDIILYATDLIPQADDLVMIRKQGRVLWGFLHPVGGWVHNGWTEEQFNSIQTWRISRHTDDQAHLSDIVVDDLELVDVVAVAIARWSSLTHGVVAATSPTFDIQKQNFKDRTR